MMAPQKCQILDPPPSTLTYSSVTVSHFFYYTPFPLCHQANSEKRFPTLDTLKSNFINFL